MNRNGGTYYHISPAPKRSVLPHVSFIIDLDLVREQGHSLEEIQARVLGVLLKILLFFYSYVDKKVIWSCQMLEIHSASALDINGNFTQNGEQLAPGSLNKLRRKLIKAFQTAKRNAVAHTGVSDADRSNNSKIGKIGLVLRNSMFNFRWSWSWYPGSQTSPIKSTTVSSRVEHYLFIISDLPRNEQAIRQYFQIHQSSETPSNEKITKLESLAIESFTKELIHKDMWEWFKTQRISVNWVEDLYDLSSRQLPWSGTFIPCLSSLFKVYSGRIIPAKLVLDEFCPLQFFRLFSTTIERYINYNITFDRFFGESAPKSLLQTMAAITDTGKFYYMYEIGLIDTNKRRKPESRLNLNLVPPQALSAKLSLFNVDYQNYQSYFYVSKNMASQLSDAKRKKLKIEPLGYCCPSTLARKKLLEDGILLCAPDFRQFKSTYNGFLALDALRISFEAQKKILAVKIEIFKSVPDLDVGLQTKKKLEIVHKLAVISPFIPGALMLNFVDDSKINSLMDILSYTVGTSNTAAQEDPNCSNTAKRQSGINGSPYNSYSLSSNKYLSMWFSLNVPKDVYNYVFSDYLPHENIGYFEDATLGVLSYSYKKAKAVTTLTNSTHNNDLHALASPLDQAPSKGVKQIEKHSTVDVYADINTFEELFQKFHIAYIDIVYDETKPILEFLECLLPSLYGVLERLSDGEDLHTESESAVGRLFDYITGHIICSVSTIENKYREIPKSFEKILNTSSNDDFVLGNVTISGLEIGNLRDWLKNALNEIDMHGTSPRSKVQLNPKMCMSKIREKIAELRTQEAKLQVVMLLECIRLSIVTFTPLPELPSKPSRISELMRPDPFSTYGQIEFGNITDSDSLDSGGNLQIRKVYLRALEELADRLCIWYSVAGMELDSGGNKLLKNFIEPIIEEFYKVSLTEIVKLLHLKAGGDAFKAEKNRDFHPSHMFIENNKLKTRYPLLRKKHKTDDTMNKMVASNPSTRMQKYNSISKNKLISKSLEHLNRRQVILREKAPKLRSTSSEKSVSRGVVFNNERFAPRREITTNPKLEKPIKTLVNNTKEGTQHEIIPPRTEVTSHTHCSLHNQNLLHNELKQTERLPKSLTLSTRSNASANQQSSFNKRKGFTKTPPLLSNVPQHSSIQRSAKTHLLKTSKIQPSPINHMLQQTRDLPTNISPITLFPSSIKSTQTVIQLKSPASCISLKSSHTTIVTNRDQASSVKSIRISTNIRGEIFEYNSPGLDADSPHSHVTIDATPGSQRRLHGLLQDFAEDLDYWEDLEFS